jgi:hypothetical protein
MKYYSAKHKGFFDSNIHKEIPEGSVELSDKRYFELLEELQDGCLTLGEDENGNPIAVEVPEEDRI